MIKFFRHIRKTLLEQNKMGKYFKYAIGEIILVMIGILLALQVNNWNNQRLEKDKEQFFLKNLQTDFKDNLKEFQTIYARSSKAYLASNRLLDIIKSKPKTIQSSEIDSLLFSITNNFGSLEFSEGTINEIINTGALNTIRDKKLRNQLSKWTQVMTDMNDDIKIGFDYLFNHVIPYLSDHTLIRNTGIPNRIIERTDLPNISDSGFQIDYRKTILTYEFENRIYFNALNYLYALNAYKLTEAYLKDTLELINKNIKEDD